MNKFSVTGLVIALTVVLTSCISNISCLEGSGTVVSQTRNLKDFESVSLMTSGNVFISQGNEESVRIEANESIIDKLKTNVKNSTLTIDSDGYICTGKLNIYITMKNINSFNLYGSGNFYNFTSIKSNEINLKTFGSGNFNFTDIIADKLGITILGSGNVNITGTAKNSVMEVNGSGNTNAGELKSAFLDVQITGSGNTKASVEKALKAKIIGSGTLRYIGNPQSVNIDKIGSGDVKKIKIMS